MTNKVSKAEFSDKICLPLNNIVSNISLHSLLYSSAGHLFT